jgi:hypothetical protein
MINKDALVRACAEKLADILLSLYNHLDGLKVDQFIGRLGGSINLAVDSQIALTPQGLQLLQEKISKEA